MSATDNLAKTSNRTRLAERLRQHLEELIALYVTRLSGDPLVPMAKSLSNPLLEDHALSFISDLFQALVVIAKAEEMTDRDETDLLTDGTKIQHLVAELHGRQRHRLGWTESALQREYQILSEEVESLVKRRAPDGDRYGDVRWALEVLTRHLTRARDASIAAHRAAARESGRQGSAHSELRA